VDEAGPEPADEFAACDASPAEPAKEEALSTQEISGAYDEPEAVPVALYDEPAAAEPEPEPEECVDPWGAPKKSKKDKKKKRDPIWDEEQRMEEAPAPPGSKSKKDKKKKRHLISDEEPPVEEVEVEEAAVDGTAIEDAPAPPAPVENESNEWERLTGADRALG
jgi:hypothetical protein